MGKKLAVHTEHIRFKTTPNNNRLNKYDLQTKEFWEEKNIIRNILYNNAFHLQTQPSRKKHLMQTRMISQNHTPLISRTPQTQHTTSSNKYWCAFTYTGKETTFVTKLFKHTNIRVAFHIYPKLQPNTINTNNPVYIS